MEASAAETQVGMDAEAEVQGAGVTQAGMQEVMDVEVETPGASATVAPAVA